MAGDVRTSSRHAYRAGIRHHRRFIYTIYPRRLDMIFTLFYILLKSQPWLTVCLTASYAGYMHRRLPGRFRALVRQSYRVMKIDNYTLLPHLRTHFRVSFQDYHLFIDISSGWITAMQRALKYYAHTPAPSCLSVARYDMLPALLFQADRHEAASTSRLFSLTHKFSTFLYVSPVIPSARFQ